MVLDLFNGERMKEVAFRYNMSYDWVRKLKLRWPLFFWKTKKRYQKFSR